MKAFLTVIFVILAIVGIVGCNTMINSGISMQSIRSQAGNTVAEEYYQQMGQAIAGLGQIFIVAILGSTVTTLYFMWTYNQAKVASVPSPAQPQATVQELEALNRSLKKLGDKNLE